MRNLLLSLFCSIVLVSAVSAADVTATAVVGKKATFSVLSVDGTAPFTYQWYKTVTGGSPVAIASATATDYVIPVLSLADAGTYYVVVTNSAGSATSNNGLITVTPAAPGTVTIKVTIQ